MTTATVGTKKRTAQCDQDRHSNIKSSGSGSKASTDDSGDCAADDWARAFECGVEKRDDDGCVCDQCRLKKIRSVVEARCRSVRCTIALTSAIDARIETMLEHFVPYGHDGPCLHRDATAATKTTCCWHFSQFYTHVVGAGAIVAWLEAYALFEEPLHVILEDFAFFAVMLNDYALVVKLAHGVLLYFEALVEARGGTAPAPAAAACGVGIATGAALLRATGWASQILSPQCTGAASAAPATAATDEMAARCAEILERRRAEFRRVLVAEELQALQRSDLQKQSANRMPFQLICHALLAPFCLDKSHLIGRFFVTFFGDILPQYALIAYNDALKRLTQRMYSTRACGTVAAAFAHHPRVDSVVDKQQRDFLRSTLARIDKPLSRAVIDVERRYVALLVAKIRYSLYKFLDSFLLFSNKLTIYVHVAPSSLLLLNMFRLHVRGSLQHIASFSYYCLANGLNIGGRRRGDDPAVVCAPYCFNCGAYMNNVWCSTMPHRQLEHTAVASQREQTFLCSCNMARYCSKRCAILHFTLHRAVCCGIAVPRPTAATRLDCREQCGSGGGGDDDDEDDDALLNGDFTYGE